MTQEASSSSSQSDYDVFLSYHTKDTGNSFSSHLFTRLEKKPTDTFLDRKKLEPGKNIFSQLMKAIEGCKFAILVISENYASSIWCYIELVKILRCKKEKGEDLTILPIFYNVEPSDVGKQKNKLAQAFERRKEDFKEEFEKVEPWEPLRKEMEKVNSWESWEDLKEKMQEVKWDQWEQFIHEMEKMDYWKRVMGMADENLWSNALQQLVDMQGGLKIDSMTMIEVDCIAEIVGKVPEAVAKTVPFYIDKPVGLESHVEVIRKMLYLGSEEIRFLGIIGSDGMGKTTIAKAVYNDICQGFKGRCSFLDMGEEKPNLSEEEESLVALQNKLVLDVTNKDAKIKDVNNGIQTIKTHLQSKKILIVVDDVDRMTQLEKLIGARDWFGKGSRIIITTRMKNLLTGLVKEEEMYGVKEMNRRDSVQFLSLHVFKENRPPEDYESVTNKVVRYAQHLPLAIEVLSPLLRNQTPKEWESLLKKWKETPHSHSGIMKVLETIFEELDKVDRAIFLAIASFFIGHDKDEVIDSLDVGSLCKGSAEARISLLSQKSLLEIKENKLWMHKMIRDMGKAIVHRKSSQRLDMGSTIVHRESPQKPDMGSTIVHGESPQKPDMGKAIVHRESSQKLDMGSTIVHRESPQMPNIRSTMVESLQRLYQRSRLWGKAAIDVRRKRIVVKLDLHDYEVREKAMKAMGSLTGVEVIIMDIGKQKLTVIGEVDSVDVVSKLGKLSHADIVSVGPEEEPKKEAAERHMNLSSLVFYVFLILLNSILDKFVKSLMKVDR